MSDKGDRRREARIRSAQKSSDRHQGRLSLKAAAEEVFFEDMFPDQAERHDSLNDEEFAIFNLGSDPALQQG